MLDPRGHLVTSPSGGNQGLGMGRGSHGVTIWSQENVGPDLPGVYVTEVIQ